MRSAVLILALIAATVFPVAAQDVPVFDDPVGLVDYAYEPYRNGEPANMDAKPIYTPTLIELFALASARGATLEFDPFVNGAEYELTDMSIDLAIATEDKALVAVGYYNFGEYRQQMFTLLKRAEGWKIDDIESVQPGPEWRLSELLAADPMLN
jgi:hypothetical protein